MFGAVKLTKTANPDKNTYSGYDIGFDTPGYHSLPESSLSKNFIILEIDISSSMICTLIKKEKIS